MKSETKSLPEWLNLNFFLAAIALFGSLYLYSKRLESNRPPGDPQLTETAIGIQKVESRLWEDPLAAIAKSKNGEKKDLTITIKDLRTQLDDAKDQVKVLAVLVAGGAYSEDRESRIRTRFAVVSGLAASGYAPKAAEHLGLAELNWLTERGLQRWVADAGNHPPSLPDLDTQRASCGCACVSIDGSVTKIGGCSDENCRYESQRQLISFEWYRQRTFYPFAPGQPVTAQRVLVLWVSEGLCEDSPMLRLGILANELGLLKQRTLDILGPRRSSTLRAMIPTAGTLSNTSVSKELEVFRKMLPTERSESSGTNNPTRPPLAFHSATASAMDEVLINLKEFKHEDKPRAQVKQLLEDTKLASFSNYTATDEAYASALYDELELRGVDVGGTTKDDLVLISEIDTFYGRVLSLTYQAEAAIRQSGTNGPATRQAFVQDYIKGCKSPENIHLVNYLRGLDGQTTEGTTVSSSAISTGPKSYTSLQTLLQEQANINRAEGQNQFDYLLRLKTQLVELDRQLRQKRNKGIRAICIVGSDAHDTMQILKAVRPEFPNTLFLTTDLDARFCDPNEWNHTRNLIVASSYGLSVPLQEKAGIMPFRDSHQMAYLVATTNILSSVTNNHPISPQLFEIGRRDPVPLLSNVNQLPGKSFPFRKIALVLIACLILCILANYLAPRVWHSIRGSRRFLRSSLWYKEEDIYQPFRILTNFDRISKDPPSESGGYSLRGEEAATIKPTEENYPVKKSALDLYLANLVKASLFESSKKNPHLQRTGNNSLRTAKTEEEFFKALIARITELDPLLPTPSAGAGQSITTQWDKSQKDTVLSKVRLEAFLSQALCAWMNQWINQKDDDKEEDELLIGADSFLSCEARTNYSRSLDRNFGTNENWEARLLSRKQIMDEFIWRLLFTSQPTKETVSGVSPIKNPCLQMEKTIPFIHARRVSYLHARENFCSWRWTIIVGFALLGIISFIAFSDANLSPGGEPLTLLQGVSIWPTEFLRLAALILGLCLIFQSRYLLKQGACEIALKYKLPLSRDLETQHRKLPAGLDADLVVDKVNDIWTSVLTLGNDPSRRWRVARNSLFYLSFGLLLAFAEGWPLSPFRGELSEILDKILLFSSVAVYLYLTFLTIDAANLGCVFINHLSHKTSEYSMDTIAFFSGQNGDINRYYINEWIDINLIADVTERLSRLLYFPFVIFLLFLVSRSSIWDNWPWPYFLVTIFVLNLIFSLLGFLLLYHSANKARAQALENLEAKVKQASAFASPEPSENDAKQAHALLEELRGIRKGAFAGFWESPILGALLIPAGGSVIFELIAYLL